MKVVHLIVGVLSIVLTGGAGVWGAWCWYRVRASPLFWRLLRAGQAWWWSRSRWAGCWC